MKKHDTLTRAQEVDLLQLIRLFWMRKRVFLIFLLLCVSLGSIFCFSVKPVYQVKYRLMPPLSSDIAAFSFGRTPYTLLQPIKPPEIYQLFQGLLFSENVIASFLAQIKKEMAIKMQSSKREHGEKTIQNKAIEKAIRQVFSTISILPIQQTNLSYPILQINARSAEEAIRIGKKFINYVEQITKDKVFSSLQEEIKTFRSFYQKEIDSGEISLERLSKEQVDNSRLVLAKIDGPIVIDKPINRKIQFMIMFFSVLLGCFLAGLFIILRYSNDLIRVISRPAIAEAQ